jgi:hypothetical protein
MHSVCVAKRESRSTTYTVIEDVALPVLIYVVVVGATLFASLFVAEAYFPAQPLHETRDIDKTTIRVHAPHAAPPSSVSLD